MTIKVLIVDDSKLIQNILKDIFASDRRFTVVGVANHPHEARTLIKETSPDVLTLDVEMPKMNGIAFLKNLMRLKPMPVVMISTLTAKGSTATVEALSLGAVDFIEKPSNFDSNFDEYRKEVIDKVLAASKITKESLSQMQGSNKTTAQNLQNVTAPRILKSSPSSQFRRLCAIGGSTGGLEAVSVMLKSVKFTGDETIVICLHLPSGFTASFANRLDALLPITVKEATDGEVLKTGHVYIAKGGVHMEVKQNRPNYYLRFNDGPSVSRHKPSVDVLFNSVAEEFGNTAMAVLLTGMGRDGADGLKSLYDIGANTFCQDEQSSVVWGMPGSAVKQGAVPNQHILPLLRLGQKITEYFSGAQ